MGKSSREIKLTLRPFHQRIIRHYKEYRKFFNPLRAFINSWKISRVKYKPDLGRQLSELIGAVGIYLGEIKSAGEGDKERLRRAMKYALHSEAFIEYMKHE